MMAKKGKSRSKRASRRTGKKREGSVTVQRSGHKGSEHKKLSEVIHDSDSVTFDGDGILVSWYGIATKLYNRSLEKRGYTTVKESYVKNALKYASPKEAFIKMGLSEAEAKDAAAEYDLNFVKERDSYDVIPGAVKALKILKANNKPINYLSNAEKKQAKASIDAIIDKYNEAYGESEVPSSLFSSIQYEAGKPGTAKLKQSMRQSNSKSTVLVGDEYSDVQTAANAEKDSKGNMYAIGVLNDSYHESGQFGDEPLPDRLAADTKLLANQLERVYAKKETIPVGQHQLVLSAANKANTRQGEIEPSITPGYMQLQLSMYRPTG